MKTKYTYTSVKLSSVKPGDEFWHTDYNKGLIKLQDGMPDGMNAASRDFGSLVRFEDDTWVLLKE